jgi:drug/metabolite transporter (DMT)-like permease
MPTPDGRTLAAFAGVVLIAGSNIVAVRFSNRELSPFWGAGLRFAIAAALMLVLARALRLSIPRGRSLRGAVGYGVLSFFVAYAFFYWGAQEVPAGVASVIMALVPLLTLVLALVQGLEPFRLRGLVGSLLAVAGIAAIAAEPPGGDLPVAFLLAIVAAAVAASESGIVVKRLPVAHPVTTNAVAMTTGAVLLLLLAFATGEEPTLPSSPSVWAAFVFLCLSTPALFVLYVYVLNRWTVTGASYQFVLFPVVGVVLGALLLGEPISASLVVGVPLVIAGVYVGALRREPIRSQRE